jgi:small conductance mechanosensitive channel
MPPIDLSRFDLSLVDDWLLGNGVRIVIIALVAFIATRLVSAAVHRVVPVAMARTQRGDPLEVKKRVDTVTSVIAQSLTLAILIIAVFTILPEVGIDIGPLLAGAGVVGIALAFGAQSIIKDVLAGLFILWEGQYCKGDVVKIAGVSGVVEDVNWRRTLVRDADGTLHNVPNGQITVASNLTSDLSKINLDILIGFRADVDLAIADIDAVGRELAADEVFGPLIVEAPHVLRVDGFTESGVILKVAGTTRPGAQWRVSGELRLRVKKRFDADGVELAEGGGPPARAGRPEPGPSPDL